MFIRDNCLLRLKPLVAVGRRPEEAKRKAGAAPARWWRAAVGTDAHSSITNTLRILEMDALVVPTDDHRLTGDALRADVPD